MPQRFLTEYIIGPGGTAITLNSMALFKSVHKVADQLVLVVEVLNAAAPEHTVEVVQKRRDTYVHPKAKYIDSVLVGKELFHFFVQPLGIEEEEDAEGEKPAFRPAQQKTNTRPPREEDLIAARKNALPPAINHRRRP